MSPNHFVKVEYVMKRCHVSPNRGIISKMGCHNLHDDRKTGDGQPRGVCHRTDSYCNRVDSLRIDNWLAFIVSISVSEK